MQGGKVTWSVAAVISASFLLTACGGTTVESDADESIAPLSREVVTSTSSEAASSSVVASSSTAASTSATAPASTTPLPAAGDGLDAPAQEITAVPTQEFESTDTAYLAALQEAGINTEGIQSEMVSAGRMVCGGSEDGVTQANILAIAGQVKSQARSEESEERIVEIIREQATRTYCP